MRIARLLLLALLISAAGCTMWGPKKNPGWKAATATEDLERLFWSDVQKKDWREIQARIAPTFTASGPTGVLNKDQLLEHLKFMDISNFQLGEFSSQPNGPDLVVTYVITLRGTIQGHALPEAPIRMMSVWQDVSGKWVLIAHSTIPTSQ